MIMFIEYTVRVEIEVSEETLYSQKMDAQIQGIRRRIDSSLNLDGDTLVFDISRGVVYHKHIISTKG